MLILNELLELFCNSYLYQKKEFLILIQPLQEKVFKIEFSDFQYSFILYFSSHHIYIFNNWHGRLSCEISTHLKDVLLLLISSNIKQEINNIYFEAKGDFIAIHDLIKLINQIFLNFSKQFFININNYLFNQIYSYMHGISESLKKKLNITKLCLNLAVTDEWRLVPHHLELLWFYKKIYVLTTQKQYLLKRLKKLEKMS